MRRGTISDGKRELTLQLMSQDLERIQRAPTGTTQVQLPIRWVYSFKLLGVTLERNWTFHQHLLEIRRKLTKRLQALRKASSTTCSLKCRILAVATHALLGGIECYGLATTGTHAGTMEMRRTDTLYLNRAARRVAGANVTMRVEIKIFIEDV